MTKKLKKKIFCVSFGLLLAAVQPVSAECAWCDGGWNQCRECNGSVIPVSNRKKRKIKDWDRAYRSSCKTRTTLRDKCAAVVIKGYRWQTLAPSHTN
jgi:hypothetical protein